MAVYQNHHYSMIRVCTTTKPTERGSCALDPGIEYGKYNSAFTITTVFCVTMDQFFIFFFYLFFFLSNDLGHTVLEGKFKYPAIPTDWHMTLKKVEDYIKTCSGINI